MPTRESLLSDTFVELADTLVTGFDVVDFLTVLTMRCVELFGAGEAGLMLADETGHLELVASSSHRMNLLELLELQHDEGPCPDAYRSGEVVNCDDLNDAIERWPNFAPEALANGFHAAHALPMRLRDDVIGALNLLRAAPGRMPAQDLRAAQALADVATVGLLQHRAIREAQLLTEQLRYALSSRVVIEQAKGVLAQQHHLDMATAFSVLRTYARSHNQRLADVAAAVVDRTLDTTTIVS